MCVGYGILNFRYIKIKSMNDKLTDKEKQSIKTLNFIAEFDGIIENEDDIKYILNQGITKFVSKKRQHLVSVTKTAYPIKIKY